MDMQINKLNTVYYIVLSKTSVESNEAVNLFKDAL